MIRRTNDEWLLLINEQRISGKSLKQWCSVKEISYYTMIDRISKLRKLGILQDEKPTHKIVDRSKWVEAQEGSRPNLHNDNPGDIRISIGAFHVTVNSAFPPKVLAEVCKELSML